MFTDSLRNSERCFHATRARCSCVLSLAARKHLVTPRSHSTAGEGGDRKSQSMAGEIATFLCKSSGKQETFSTRPSAPLLSDISLADKLARSWWVLLTSRLHRTERYADRRCPRRDKEFTRHPIYSGGLARFYRALAPVSNRPSPIKRPSGMYRKYPPIYTDLCHRDVQNMSVSARKCVQ
jgi:hypothetical protein